MNLQTIKQKYETDMRKVVRGVLPEEMPFIDLSCVTITEFMYNFIETTICEVLEEVRLKEKPIKRFPFSGMPENGDDALYNQAVTELNTKIDGILGDGVKVGGCNFKRAEPFTEASQRDVDDIEGNFDKHRIDFAGTPKVWDSDQKPSEWVKDRSLNMLNETGGVTNMHEVRCDIQAILDYLDLKEGK